jgi:hypothetical protein
MVAQQILVLLVRVQILLGQCFWSLRLSARMEDSQSSERGSIPLGTKTKLELPAFNRLVFFG